MNNKDTAENQTLQSAHGKVKKDLRIHSFKNNYETNKNSGGLSQFRRGADPNYVNYQTLSNSKGGNSQLLNSFSAGMVNPDREN